MRQAREGRRTRDHPIRLDEAMELVLPVSDERPEEAHKLMRHHRQRTRRPSVVCGTTVTFEINDFKRPLTSEIDG